MKLKKNEVLVIKRCVTGNLATNNFVYPPKGECVEATDWVDDEDCGGGLHGWTLGFDTYFNDSYKGNFVALLVNKNDGYVELGDKVKFRKGKVLYNGEDSREAHKLMRSMYPNMKLHWNIENQTDNSTVRQGYNSVAKQGDYATANQEDYCVASQGKYSAVSQGYNSVAKQGNNSTANQKDACVVEQGWDSIANQGKYSAINQRHCCKVTQENGSVSNQRYNSVANQGNNCTANQESGGVVSQGNNCTANQKDECVANQGSCCTANQEYGGVVSQGNHCTANQWGACTASQGDRSVSVHRGQTNNTAIIKFARDSVAVLYNAEGSPVVYTQFQNVTVYFYDSKPTHQYTITPDNIQTLEEHEIFVFGSNLYGNHIGGSAKLAKDKFGAVEGVGEGLTKSSYAFPTLDKNMKKVSDGEFKNSIQKLINSANENTTKIFLVTKVGCGIAGFTEEKVKAMFKTFKGKLSANLILPWEI
jgi:hypothetical protein